MASLGHHQLVRIARELQSRCQILIPQRPVAVQVVQIFFSLLQVDLDRLGLVLGLPHQPRIGPAAADVGEAADVAEHLAELVGTLPRDGESGDSAGGDAADRAVLGVLRDIEPLQRHGEKFLDQELGVPVTERVIFKRPVAAVFGPGLDAGIVPGLTKTAIVTGIAFWWIRLSKMTGTRNAPSVFA